jgi:fermentation-respiration switch protein FrsA (DUF1100 family)
MRLPAALLDKPREQRSIGRRILYTLAFLYATGTVSGGIALGWIAVHPPSHPVTASEERSAQTAARETSVEFRDAELTTPDGVVLRAWFMRPAETNGDAVILLHGVSDNRMGMYGYGRWLVQHRYTVLIPDARAHGNSTGLATYGLKESDDVHRWVEWLGTTAHPHCSVRTGRVDGSGAVIAVVAEGTAILCGRCRIAVRHVSRGAYARFGRPFHTGPWIGRTFFRPTVDIGFLFVRLKYGLNMEAASPKQAVVGTTIPILFIHGLQDRNIPPYHSDLIQQENPSSVTIWKVPGAVHTQAHKAAPQEFERRVLDWFALHS